jgi:hypothetical protein
LCSALDKMSAVLPARAAAQRAVQRSSLCRQQAEALLHMQGNCCVAGCCARMRIGMVVQVARKCPSILRDAAAGLHFVLLGEGMALSRVGGALRYSCTQW